VPFGYPGAGNLIFASYNAHILYHVPFTIDGAGFYQLSNQVAQVSVSELASGPEGIAYIPIGSAGFPNPSMVISSYGYGTVIVYEVGAEGLPVAATGRQMVTGLTGAEGALIDPVTGDFLFSTFGGGNKVIRITGFEAPSAIGDKNRSKDLAFSVYPNPTDGELKVVISEPGSKGTIEVCNILGECVANRFYSGNGTYELDLSAQPQGVYIIRVKDEDKEGAQRIIRK
jgi:hypothetical protein